MITIRIGSSERTFEQADTAWVVQQINRRKQDGQVICVQVIIHNDYLNMSLSTPNCSGAGGSGRPPNNEEQEIFDLWKKRGLNEEGFSVGDLISFLNQLKGVVYAC